MNVTPIVQQHSVAAEHAISASAGSLRAQVPDVTPQRFSDRVEITALARAYAQAQSFSSAAQVYAQAQDMSVYARTAVQTQESVEAEEAPPASPAGAEAEPAEHDAAPTPARPARARIDLRA